MGEVEPETLRFGHLGGDQGKLGGAGFRALQDGHERVAGTGDLVEERADLQVGVVAEEEAESRFHVVHPVGERAVVDLGDVERRVQRDQVAFGQGDALIVGHPVAVELESERQVLDGIEENLEPRADVSGLPVALGVIDVEAVDQRQRFGDLEIILDADADVLDGLDGFQNVVFQRVGVDSAQIMDGPGLFARLVVAQVQLKLVLVGDVVVDDVLEAVLAVCPGGEEAGDDVAVVAAQRLHVGEAGGESGADRVGPHGIAQRIERLGRGELNLSAATG